MKRIILSIIGILLIIVCHAHVVPREKAAATAADVFRSIHTPTGTPVSEPRLVKQDSNMYVFENEGGGYAVVAADDISVPVLGFATSGRFPLHDMPDNLRALLDWYGRVISFAKEQGWEVPTTVRSSAGASEKEVLLKTAHWNQWHPFNDLSPTVEGKKCPSGCVATAIAIIMKYHKYPEKGTGVLPDYDFGWDSKTSQYQYHIKGHALGHKYDWKSMPDEASSYTDYESAQIAQLLYDIGVMCQMDFYPTGSGAASTCPLSLCDYFDYDRSMRYFDREYFSTNIWEQMIRDEIDAGRPVFHCGYSEEGGHAFVVDGYKGNYFSLNYGWGGGSSYYLLTPIEGHNRELTEFYRWQSIVTHIMPNQGGAPYLNPLIPYNYIPFGWNFENKTMPGGDLYLWSYSTGSGEMDVAYAIYDKNGQFKQLVSTVEKVMLLSYQYVSLPEMSINLPEAIADGDCIKLSRLDGEEWSPIPQESNCSFRFDRSRPLRQMVSVGHKFGWPFEGEVDDSFPVVFFDMYKDIWWELQNEEGTVLITSGLQWWGPCYVPASSAQLLDEESRLMRYALRLTAGRTYRMVIRNFNETLTFTFSM